MSEMTAGFAPAARRRGMAMLGGFLEYNSMYFGFRSLYLLALAMYFLAFVTSVRLPGAVSQTSNA